MDGDSMKLNRSRNVFISPRSSSECLRRHSSVVHKNSGPEEFTGGQQQFLKEAKRRSWSTTGINEIASNSFETMSADQLRELILMLTGNIDELQNELRNASAENLNLRHQLQCRTKKNPSHLEHMPNNSSFRRSNNNASQRCSSVVPFECDESLVEHAENSIGCDEEIMYLVPEDLKNDEPSRVSVFLSQSMTVLAHINNQEVIEKVCAGSQVAKQVTVGGVAGYFTSHLIRKFGKIAVGSIIGSLCFIKFAHHRGYIAVDWNKIQKQIENPNASGAGDGSSNVTVENDIAWLTDKYQKIRKWSKENSYTVLGFWAGFCAHNLYT